MKSASSIFLVVAFALTADLIAQDWAHWRGPEQNGISRETGLIDDWSLDDNTNVLWTSETGGRATPVILNDRVYLNCRTHHDFNDPEEKFTAANKLSVGTQNPAKNFGATNLTSFKQIFPHRALALLTCVETRKREMFTCIQSAVFFVVTTRMETYCGNIPCLKNMEKSRATAAEPKLQS